jgi:hypothetical protein
MTSLIEQFRGSTTTSDEVDRRHLRQLYIDIAIAVIDAPLDVERLLSMVPTSCHHEVYELVLQSYLFGGFPTALDALQSCYRVLGAPPSIGEVGTTVKEAVIRERGEVLCREIYGNVFDKMFDALASVSPDLAQWMITEGYGKTLSRPGCDTVTRELCIVAMLTVLAPGAAADLAVGSAGKGSSTAATTGSGSDLSWMMAPRSSTRKRTSM